MLATPTQIQTFERIVSWGPEPKKVYFACDYETFKMLKAIKKAFFKAQRQASNLRRWLRKAPHNRFVSLRSQTGDKAISKRKKTTTPIPEPKVIEFFIQREVSRWTGQTRVYINNAEFPIECDNASRPCTKPEDVRPMYFSVEKIREVYLMLYPQT